MRTISGPAMVLGDLVTDVVLLPGREIRTGTDVAGRVAFRQGGSAATTARVLAARGVSTTLITALGRDAAGDALATYMERCGVAVRATRVARETGRLGVLVASTGERSFVADRGAILALRPRHIRRDWFRGVSLLHLPGYSLIGEGLADASERAADFSRAEGAAISIDLSSAGFIEDAGISSITGRIQRIRPDLLFANESERQAVVDSAERLLDLAPLVVVKQGAAGACAFGRELPAPVAVAAPAAEVSDTTGAGDAFDGGFLAAWLMDRRPGAVAHALRAAHQASRREITGKRLEFGLGLTLS